MSEQQPPIEVASWSKFLSAVWPDLPANEKHQVLRERTRYEQADTPMSERHFLRQLVTQFDVDTDRVTVPIAGAHGTARADSAFTFCETCGGLLTPEDGTWTCQQCGATQPDDRVEGTFTFSESQEVEDAHETRVRKADPTERIGTTDAETRHIRRMDF